MQPAIRYHKVDPKGRVNVIRIQTPDKSVKINCPVGLHAGEVPRINRRDERQQLFKTAARNIKGKVQLITFLRQCDTAVKYNPKLIDKQFVIPERVAIIYKINIHIGLPVNRCIAQINHPVITIKSLQSFGLHLKGGKIGRKVS